MSVLPGRPWVRWAVPIAVTALAVGGASVVTRLSASADAALSPRSAAQLLADVQSARLSYGSGTVVQTADLGLPQLPTIGGAGSSDLTSLISGNHTLRVWYGGPAKARLALLGTLGESDVILNGRDLWTWSSDSNSATHRVLGPEVSAHAKAPSSLGELAGPALTPQQLADRALAAINPSTSVTTDGTAQVAGRSAYELVLAPKDTSSLVGQIRIAIDGARRVPLRVQIFAKNAAKPAVEVGFTQISFTRPSDAQFRFTPPPGAKVTQTGTTGSTSSGHAAQTPPASGASGPKATPDRGTPGPSGPGSSGPDSSGPEPVVSGTGWTSVIQAQLPAGAGGQTSGTQGEQLRRILAVLPQESGSWGTGRLLRSSLFSVLLTDQGRLLAGAVPPQRLYQLAAQPLPAPARPGSAVPAVPTAPATSAAS